MCTYTNDTPYTQIYQVYCTVPGCTTLIGTVTLLPHTTIVITEATCNVPKIVARYTQNQESEHGG